MTLSSNGKATSSTEENTDSNSVGVSMQDIIDIQNLVGKTIVLTEEMKDPLPIEVGTKGKVICVTKFPEDCVIGVHWENGRSLNLVAPPDKYAIIEEKKI